MFFCQPLPFIKNNVLYFLQKHRAIYWFLGCNINQTHSLIYDRTHKHLHIHTHVSKYSSKCWKEPSQPNQEEVSKKKVLIFAHLIRFWEGGRAVSFSALLRMYVCSCECVCICALRMFLHIYYMAYHLNKYIISITYTG